MKEGEFMNDAIELAMIPVRPVKGFTGYYVGTDGNVYTDIPKGARRDLMGGYMRVPLHPVASRPGANGYMRVYMREDKTNHRKDQYVHRMVAEAFIPNPDDKPCVNHKDTDRTNNSLENLEWVTHAENNEHTMKIGHVTRNEENGQFQSNI